MNKTFIVNALLDTNRGRFKKTLTKVGVNPKDVLKESLNELTYKYNIGYENIVNIEIKEL